jgi:thioesterase domain-containing protein
MNQSHARGFRRVTVNATEQSPSNSLKTWSWRPELETYRGWGSVGPVPKPYDGAMTLFRATGMGLASYDDPYLGWGEVAGIDIEVIEVPGVHRSILREEDTRALVEKLSDRLRLAQEGRSVSA